MNTQAHVASAASAPAAAANGQLTPLQQAQARIAELEAALAAKGTGAVSFKCYAKGEKYTDSKGVAREGKGVLSMSGIGVHPASYYESQWNTIIAAVKDGRVEKAIAHFKALGKLASKADNGQ